MSESPNNVSDVKSEWTDNVSDFGESINSLHTMEFHNVSPSAAEMAASIFHSFEADAIFSFKCRKPFIFMKNRHIQC